MYVQVVTYSLDGISEEEYLDVANRLAPRIAALPGLEAKLWLENPGGNRYGAIYFWDDLESMERFGDSDLFEGRTPEFTDFVVEEFGVLKNLTAMTQPGLQILEARRPPEPPAATSAPAKETGVKARRPTATRRQPSPRRTPVPASAATAKAPAAKGAKAAKAVKATKAPSAPAAKTTKAPPAKATKATARPAADKATTAKKKAGKRASR